MILVDGGISVCVSCSRDSGFNCSSNNWRSISTEFLKEAGHEIKEQYAVWNLVNWSGVILTVLEESVIEIEPRLMEVNEQALFDGIIKISELEQRTSDLLNRFGDIERTLLIRRTDIFTLLENEWIGMGIEDTLKLAKRPLEYKLFKQSTLEKILKRPINEIFVDWSLKADKGYAVLTLQKSKHENSFSSEMLFFMCWQRKIPEASGYLLVLLLLENILILTKQAL